MARDPAIDPISQLERSHRRLEEACAALLVAVAGHDLETVADIAAFFGRQGRRHEEDEDLSVFPRLRAEASLAPALGDELSRLGEEHLAHAELHRRLDDAVTGRLDPAVDTWVELASVASALDATYRAHIEREETRIFPLARATLGPADLAAIRTEMDARRGR